MAQPSNIDIISGLDPTALSSITGAQLETMVGGATPFTDKGIVMVTTDASLNSPNVPAAQTTTKWQTYLWIRIQPANTAVSLYAWNPNGGSDATFLQWQNITLSSIPSGSIQGYQLAPSTVTSDKILNIQLSQIVGWQSLLTTVLTPTIQTQISGSYALGFTINNGVVTLAMLDQTGLITQVLTAQGIGSAPIWQTPPQIATGLPNPNAGGAQDGYVVEVNSGAAGTFKYQSMPNLATQIAPSLATSAANSFTSTLVTVTAGAVSIQAHGLASKPAFLRAVMVCGTSELGYSVGDEVDYATFQPDNANLNTLGALSVNVTNVTFQFVNSFGSGIFLNKLASVAGTPTFITATNWKLKIYARL